MEEEREARWASVVLGYQHFAVWARSEKMLKKQLTGSGDLVAESLILGQALDEVTDKRHVGRGCWPYLTRTRDAHRANGSPFPVKNAALVETLCPRITCQFLSARA